MLGGLGERFKAGLGRIGKQARLTEDSIKPALNDLRLALLEADTAIEVVTELLTRLRQAALGEEVQKKLSPSQVFMSTVHKELTKILGGQAEPLNMRVQPPAVFLQVGLQGSGKTTNLAKLGLWLKKLRKKKSLLVSLDTTRPAAAEQLRVLADKARLDYYHGDRALELPELAATMLEQAQLGGYDCLLVDTAGRARTEEARMDELAQIHAVLKPAETLYVLDCMAGQDAARAAQAFKAAAPVSGVVITKADSSARGGAILSVQYLIGAPIKMMSNGEELTDIQDFDPAKIANRIMGTADAGGLLQKAQMTAQEGQARPGNHFGFSEMRAQLVQLQKMGGLSAMAEKLGLQGAAANLLQQQMDDKQTRKYIGFIDAMTPWERRNPQQLNGSRKLRISRGSGGDLAEFNRMLKKFKMMRKTGAKMKTAKGRQRMMNQLGGMPSGMIPPPSS